MKNITTLVGTLLMSSAVWAAEVDVNAGYVRAVPPGQPNSAAFMELTNRGSDAVDVTGARSAVAGAVELHTHSEDQGVMRMRRIDHIQLPAQTTVALKPGGLHIMLIGLEQTLAEGGEVEMTLQFSDGSEQAVTLPVKPVMPMHQ